MTDNDRTELRVLADYLEDLGHCGCELLRRLADEPPVVTPGGSVQVYVSPEQLSEFVVRKAGFSTFRDAVGGTSYRCVITAESSQAPFAEQVSASS